jgi:hypothetical protein
VQVRSGQGTSGVLQSAQTAPEIHFCEVVLEEGESCGAVILEVEFVLDLPVLDEEVGADFLLEGGVEVEGDVEAAVPGGDLLDLHDGQAVVAADPHAEDVALLGDRRQTDVVLRLDDAAQLGQVAGSPLQLGLQQELGNGVALLLEGVQRQLDEVFLPLFL